MEKKDQIQNENEELLENEINSHSSLSFRNSSSVLTEIHFIILS